MADPTGISSLVSPLSTYRNYLTRAKTNTFRGYYAAVLWPYKIDKANTAGATAPEEVARQIYAVVQEEVPTAFLQWHGRAQVGKRSKCAVSIGDELHYPHRDAALTLGRPLLCDEGQGHLRHRHVRQLADHQPLSYWNSSARPYSASNRHRPGRET